MLVLFLLPALVVECYHGVEHVLAALDIGYFNIHVYGIALLVEHIHTHVLHDILGAEQVAFHVSTNGDLFAGLVELGGPHLIGAIGGAHIHWQRLVLKFGEHFEETFLNLDVGFTFLVNHDFEGHAYRQRVEEFVGGINLDGRVFIQVLTFEHVLAQHVESVEL